LINAVGDQMVMICLQVKIFHIFVVVMFVD